MRPAFFIKMKKSVIPYFKSPESKETTWDASIARQQFKEYATKDEEIDFSEYSKGFAFVIKGEEENLTGYTFPHHYIEDGEITVSREGLSAAMGRLHSGDNPNMTEADRKGVHNHLAKHYEDLDLEVPEFKSIDKAVLPSDPNAFVWIFNDNTANLDEQKFKVEVLDSEKGIARYVNKETGDIVAYRFNRETGWSEETASIYALTQIKSVDEAQKALDEIQIHKGGIQYSFGDRQNIYIIAKKIFESNNLAVEPLNTQRIYKTMKSIKEKMKELAEVSNISFKEFIEYSNENRLDVIKNNSDFQAIQKQGAKVFGTVKAIKLTSTDSEGNTEDEKWVLRSVFTSNKADSTYDITSQEAIKKGVDGLSGKVIPIRYEHQSDDYGVWHKFWTEEKDGVLYGYAEGELDKSLNRAQDLWTELYEYKKQFATSYGAVLKDFSWETDEKDNQYRVLNELEFYEISLTTRPANPDTALEALSKHASQLESYIEVKNLQKSDMDNENQDEVVSEVAETTETVTEEAPQESAESNESVEATATEETNEEEKASDVEGRIASLEATYEEVRGMLDELSARIDELQAMMSETDKSLKTIKSLPAMPVVVEKTVTEEVSKSSSSFAAIVDKLNNR